GHNLLSWLEQQKKTPRVLQEAGGGQRAPGDSVTLSCHGSGFTFGYYDIYWYRQFPGGIPEWVSCISYLGDVKYGAAVQGRATASRDNSQFQSSLVLGALHPSDSARYFCAIHTETGNQAELQHKPPRAWHGVC
uniref:Ig-like domain-containing protein n=1 Tax=Serinus canaria TaxID=9135 RepID=A0A8C9NEE6_SERCA